MNFKNKQAMRYGGKSNMATSYRTNSYANGGPGDPPPAGSEEEIMFGRPVSEIDKVAAGISEKYHNEHATTRSNAEIEKLRDHMRFEKKVDDKGNVSYGPHTRKDVMNFWEKESQVQGASYFDDQLKEYPNLTSAWNARSMGGDAGK